MRQLSIRDEVALTSFKDQKDRVGFMNVYGAFTNRGLMEDKNGTIQAFDLRDLVTTQDLTRYIPQTIETVIREALEPNLFVVNRLFQTINIPRGSRVQIGAIGQLEAARVGQGGEYKQKNLDVADGDMVALTTDKYGLKISLTQEVLDENLFDVVGIWLRAAGKALARAKERAAAKLINEMGFTVFDNVAPINSELGVTTGRGIDGVQNGSMTVNDTFDMYAWLLHRGFSPDVIMMHPLSWKTFMCDTEMREVVLKGATVASNRNPNGSPANPYATGHGGLGVRTGTTGTQSIAGDTPKGANAWVNTLNPLGNTFNIAPSYLPTPLEVIVTPYVPFIPGNKANIIMMDSSNCGLYGQGKPVTTGTWSDPERDIENIKVSESWGLAVLEQGKAIAKATNISTERNYNFENANNRTLAPLNKTAPIV